MKTAEERAAELMEEYRKGGFLTRAEFVKTLTLAFKEYARDQRHACAEAVMALEVEYEGYGTARIHQTDAARHLRTDAHAACMNAPFPGEGG